MVVNATVGRRGRGGERRGATTLDNSRKTVPTSFIHVQVHVDEYLGVHDYDYGNDYVLTTARSRTNKATLLPRLRRIEGAEGGLYQLVKITETNH